MRREDCRIGMPVMFGRGNGEQTKGVIVKLNDKSAKVKTTEDRGRNHPAGVVWGVGYGLISPLDPKDQAAVAEAAQAIPAPTARVLKYNPFSQDNLILEAVLQVYSGLEPESLTCDGEASPAHIRSKRTELNRKLKGLQYALGYEITASESFDWFQSKQEYDRNRQQRNANAERTAEICGLPQGIH